MGACGATLWTTRLFARRRIWPNNLHPLLKDNRSIAILIEWDEIMVCVRVCVVLRTPVQMYLARWVQFFYTIAKLQMHQHKRQHVRNSGTSGIPVPCTCTHSF